ncbi:MAG: hypothetical protein ABIH11_04350 [Candidatus Altiarchaeota archaeon]
MPLKKVTIRTTHWRRDDDAAFDLIVSDTRLGNDIEHAFRSASDRKFDALAEHAVVHQRFQDENVLHQDDSLMFNRLTEDGFFDTGVRRPESDVQVFNLLRRIQQFVPESDRESFFTRDGVGGRLLATVREHQKLGPPPVEDVGRGHVSDYLRRVGSILPFMPESDRRGFLSKEVPEVLAASTSYVDFLERTMPYVRKYVKSTPVRETK